MTLGARLKSVSFPAQWALLGFALLLLGGATAFDLWVELDRTEKREQSRLQTQAQVIQENLLANLASVNQVLKSLSKDLPELAANPAATRRLETLTVAMPGIRTLLAVDSQGICIASNRPELIGRNLAHRDYFNLPRQNPDADTLFVTPPFKNSLGVFSINVARIIPGPRGEFGGVVTATLDPDYFKTLMASVLYADDMVTAIAHGDGIQFVMQPERNGAVGKNLAQPGSFFSRHRDGGQQVSTLTGIAHATGEELMMAIRSLQPPELRQDKALVVAVGRKLEAVYSTWWHDALTHGGLLAVFALGSIAALNAYQRRQREFERLKAADAVALAAHERFLTNLTNNIPGMVGYWNSELRCEFANHAYLEWFGRTPEQMRGIRIQDLMGEALFSKNEPFIRAALRGERQSFERTLTKADGSIGYTWAQYIPDVLPGGAIRGFYVLVSDITEMKRTALALAESELKLRTIIDTEPECVKVVAADGTLLQMNRAGLDMVEAESELQVLGLPVTDLVAPEYRQAFLDLNDRISLGESGSLEFEIIGLKGGRRWVDSHAVPMRDRDGQLKGQLAVTRDITARKQAEQELKRLAQTDPLTGLVNRRHFLQLAEQELSRTKRYGGPLSVLMVDIDHFKTVNDTLGHKAGDLLLQKFADLAQQELREPDVIGRLGGEEFAVMLPQTSLRQAQETADRLRQKVAAACAVSEGGKTLAVTISIGVASWGPEIEEFGLLLNNADHALYEAKNGGRNTVRVYGDTPEPLRQT